VIVDQPFLNEFVRLAREANYWVHLAPSTRIRTSSSLLPLYERLKQSHAHQVNIEWDPLIKDMVLQLSLEKQRQYSAVIKYVQKRLTGQESKIFATLRRALPGGGFLSEKLSKAQQTLMTDLWASNIAAYDKGSIDSQARARGILEMNGVTFHDASASELSTTRTAMIGQADSLIKDAKLSPEIVKLVKESVG